MRRCTKPWHLLVDQGRPALPSQHLLDSTGVNDHDRLAGPYVVLNALGGPSASLVRAAGQKVGQAAVFRHWVFEDGREGGPDSVTAQEEAGPPTEAELAAAEEAVAEQVSIRCLGLGLLGEASSRGHRSTGLRARWSRTRA